MSEFFWWLIGVATTPVLFVAVQLALFLWWTR